MKIKRLSEILNENISHEEGSSITIEVIENDERNPNRNKKPVYSVNYQKEIDGHIYEIEGRLKSYHSGRSDEYEFEPDDFTDDESENYYDENWEEIQDEILNKFNNM